MLDTICVQETLLNIYIDFRILHKLYLFKISKVQTNTNHTIKPPHLRISYQSTPHSTDFGILLWRKPLNPQIASSLVPTPCFQPTAQ
jgi:hypothetical protein